MGEKTPDLPLPVLTTGTPVLARSDGRLQIGCEPGSALLLDLDPDTEPGAVAGLLDTLRGTVDRRQLAARLRTTGLTAAEFTALIDRLVAAGKAVAPAPQSLRRLRVRVLGRSTLAQRLAARLVAAGLPVLTDSVGPGALTRSRRLDCNLAVLADRLLVDPPLRLALMKSRTPHLAVGVRDGIGVIGPLVLPGHSSCLRCADLYRSELDPEWPVLAARLAAAPIGDAPELVALTAALACQEIEEIAARLADPAGTPPQTVDHRLHLHLRPAGTTLIGAPAHPRCTCRSAVRPPVHYPRQQAKGLC